MALPSVVRPVSFRWSDEFVRRIDRARGDVPRSVFVRRCVERALGEREPEAPIPASAERPEESSQPRSVYRGPEVEAEWREGLSRVEAFRRASRR